MLEHSLPSGDAITTKRGPTVRSVGCRLRSSPRAIACAQATARTGRSFRLSTLDFTKSTLVALKGAGHLPVATIGASVLADSMSARAIQSPPTMPDIRLQALPQCQFYRSASSFVRGVHIGGVRHPHPLSVSRAGA